MHRTAITLSALVLALAACGGDDGTSPATSPGRATVPAGVPATDGPPADLPSDLTDTAVCELVATDVVADALTATEVEAAPGGMSTPQCSYSFQDAEGSFTNIVTTVQRAEGDLDGKVGADAFEYAVELNRLFAGDAVFLPVTGVGDQAVYAQGQLGLLIAQVGPRIVTVAGTPLDQASATAIGAALADALAAAG